jgi:hypothetical protein
MGRAGVVGASLSTRAAAAAVVLAVVSASPPRSGWRGSRRPTWRLSAGRLAGGNGVAGRLNPLVAPQRRARRCRILPARCGARRRLAHARADSPASQIVFMVSMSAWVALVALRPWQDSRQGSVASWTAVAVGTTMAAAVLSIGDGPRPNSTRGGHPGVILAAGSSRMQRPMVAVAQVVRASGCGPEGRGFESPRSPQRRWRGALPG